MSITLLEPIAPAVHVRLLDKYLIALSQLDEPHKTVAHKVIFDQEDFDWIASCLDKTSDQVIAIYTEAIDHLSQLLSG